MHDHRPFFLRTLKSRYPEKFEELVAQTEAHYQVVSADTTFAYTSGNPIDRRLDFSAYFLALIITMDKAGESFATIREVCLEVVIAYVQPRNKVQAFFKRLLPKLITTWPAQRLVRIFAKKVGTNTHPDGFRANIITDKKETYGLGYGVDIMECGICKLFNKHSYGKYASILCEVDEVTSGLAGLKLIRTGTIANGAHKCDFRFKRV